MDQDRQINLQQAQLEEQAATETLANNLQTRSLVSRAAQAQAESGGMLNNNAIIQDTLRQGLVANTMVGQNLSRDVAQLGEQRLGATSTAQSRINSVSKGTGVNYLGAGITRGTNWNDVLTRCYCCIKTRSSSKFKKLGNPK